jgi:hypothetical protein
LTKIQRSRKPVSSFRISAEGTRQLKVLAQSMGRSESNVIEIAIDRMYREENRFGCLSVHGQKTNTTLKKTRMKNETDWPSFQND